MWWRSINYFKKQWQYLPCISSCILKKKKSSVTVILKQFICLSYLKKRHNVQARLRGQRLQYKGQSRCFCQRKLTSVTDQKGDFEETTTRCSKICAWWEANDAYRKIIAESFTESFTNWSSRPVKVWKNYPWHSHLQRSRDTPRAGLKTGLRVLHSHFFLILFNYLKIWISSMCSTSKWQKKTNRWGEINFINFAAVHKNKRTFTIQIRDQSYTQYQQR